MSEKKRLFAVIPAAGLSSRMGAFKPLLPCGDSTVLERSVSSVLPYAERVAVVLGKRADDLKKLLKDRFGDRVTIAENPDYASTDMLHSVQIGLRAIGACDAFFLLPGDMPMVSGAVFEALAAAFDGEADVIYPVINGRRGHPPLIRARLIPEILGYKGDGGLRAILSGRKVKEIALADQGILTDLDTPEDYQSLGPDQRPQH